eukprot:1763465-Ditylum_brightwellii.AAC.1
MSTEVKSCIAPSANLNDRSHWSSVMILRYPGTVIMISRELNPFTEIPMVSRRLERDKLPMLGLWPFFPFCFCAIVKAVEFAFDTV